MNKVLSLSESDIVHKSPYNFDPQTRKSDAKQKPTANEYSQR